MAVDREIGGGYCGNDFDEVQAAVGNGGSEEIRHSAGAIRGGAADARVTNNSMISEKPWKADGLILLVAGLLLSMSMGMLLAQALPKFFPSVAELDQLFVRFIISTLSVQGVALVLCHQFFRWHGARWGELLVSPERSWLNALGTGLVAGLLVIPIALLLLNFVSLELMKLVQL